MYYIFLGLHPSMAALLRQGLQKTHLAFRPSTARGYDSMFRLFLAFTIFMRINVLALSPLALIAYLQFLETNKISAASMSNHLSAIKAKLALFGLPVYPFSDPRIKYFQKAMILHRPFKVTLKKIIDIHTLQLIVRACDFTYMGQVFKAVYTIAFFSFLRLSNLVPHCNKSFSPLYHLARADILFAPPGLQIIIKWTKTLQSRDAVKIIKIPSLGSNAICPVKAVKNLLHITPGHRNDPLFQYKTPKGWFPLTDNQVRSHFKLILRKLGLQDSNLTFHAFRRSGATHAFNSNVNIQQIQSHGTWTSDCIWRYITLDHNTSSQVALAFKKQLHIPTS